MNKSTFKNSIFSLADRLYPMVVRLLGNSNDAKDAIQDVMVKLWDKRDQLAQHPNQKGFVFLTARNHCLDVLKKRKKVVVEFTEKTTSTQLIDDKSYAYRELKTLIEEILETCPVLHKEILILRDIDGLEYQEIAEIKNLSVEHLRVIISRTRKYVQLHLTKHYNYG